MRVHTENGLRICIPLIDCREVTLDYTWKNRVILYLRFYLISHEHCHINSSDTCLWLLLLVGMQSNVSLRR